MRKPQIQPSLASLTEADREQLADWLRREHYDVVRDRVNKPRPEGFGLNISEKPLRTFYAKVALLDLINGRIVASAASTDKKLTLAEFESLAAGEILLQGDSLPNCCSEQNEKSPMLNPHLDSRERTSFLGNKLEAALGTPCSMKNEEINILTTAAHAAILRTTHDLATSSANTPAQLLALQRLADFPARAAARDELSAFRAHKKEMDLHRKQIATERLELAAQKHAHKVEMDHFRKHIATQRLELATQSLALRRQQPQKPSALALEPFPSDETLARLGVTEYYLRCVSTEYRTFIPKRARELGQTVEQFLFDLVKFRHRLEGREPWPETDTNPRSAGAPAGNCSPAPETTSGVPSSITNIINHQSALPASPEPPLEPFPSDQTLARLGLKPEHLASYGPDYRTYIPECARSLGLSLEQFLHRLLDQDHKTEATLTDDQILALTFPPSTNSPSESEISNPQSPAPSSITNSQFSISNSQSKPTDDDSSRLITDHSPTLITAASPSSENNQSSISHNQSDQSSQSPSLAATVDAYTINRAREYWSHRRAIASAHPSENPPEYITQYRHCPCGSGTPCPIHESETYGPLPSWFWSRSPHSPHYAACLRDRDLPYRDPQEFL